MFFSLTTALAALATTAHAQYFHLEPFSVTHTKVPSENHTIGFTISNPEAVFEQGGSYARNCTITWTTESAPTCWTACQDDGMSPSYYVRVAPESYTGPEDFTLEVEEYYTYRNSARNNATIVVLEKQQGYRCSPGAQSNICGYWGEPLGVNATFTATYSVPPRDDVCNDCN